MAGLSNVPQLYTYKITSPSIPLPLTCENVLKYTQDVATPARKPTAQQPSPGRTFLCQEKSYPRKRSEPTRPDQRAYANSSPSNHWRGGRNALFKLDPVAKYNIRDHLAGQCDAHNETSNELTKPTGTRVVFVLQSNAEGGEQEALCVPTTPVTLHGIYSFRYAENDNTVEPFDLPVLPPENIQSGAMQIPRGGRGTASFADEEDFPQTDRELDSDSDDEEGHRSKPSTYAPALDAITEGNEDEESDTGFVDVVDYGAPKYCRDPDSAHHPECHGRFKTTSYAHSAIDAELDFQERFAIAQDGGSGAVYYRNWRSLKLDYGAAMVHGRSSLRNAIVNLDDSEEEEEEEEEEADLDDPTELLLRLIAAKYGPLTLEGQKTKPAGSEHECSDECNAKVNKYLDQDLENDLWPSDHPFSDEHEELISEPSILFDGVADFSEEEAHAPVPAPTSSQTGVVTPISEDDLGKILNTPHEDFIDNYVQRYETMRKNAARAKQARNEVAHPAASTDAIVDDPMVAVDNVQETIIALPKIVVTAGTPLSSPIEDVPPSGLQNVDHELATHPSTDTISVASDPVSKKTEAPAAVCMEDLASKTPPAFVHYDSVRPISAQSFCSSRNGSSLDDSVFSRQASVTTKPSKESFGSDYLRLVNTTEPKVDLKSAPTTVSCHDRSVSTPALTSSASDTCETTPDVSTPIHSVHARPTYVVTTTPVRATVAANKCLTPIIEVQTPLSTTSVPQVIVHPTNTMGDSPEAFRSTFEYQHPNTHIATQATRLPREGEHPLVPPIPASLFTDDSSLTSHRSRNNKLATIKYRVRAVVAAAKRATHQALRSVKTLCTTVRHFGSVTSGTRNPYETFARA